MTQSALLDFLKKNRRFLNVQEKEGVKYDPRTFFEVTLAETREMVTYPRGRAVIEQIHEKRIVAFSSHCSKEGTMGMWEYILRPWGRETEPCAYSP